MNIELKMNSDIQLTPHFKLSEFTRSKTAQHYCIDNSLPSQFLPLVRGLAAVLEDLREETGNNCFWITSGYRCPILNKIVGGAVNSKHMQCTAVDFSFPLFKIRTPKILKALSKHPVRFIKIYPDKHFIHVDFPSNYLKSIGEKYNETN